MKFTGRPRLLTDEEICRMYAEVMDSETVAYHAQCSGSTVLAIVRKHGGEVNKRGGRPKPLTTSDAEICRLYKSGLSGAQVASQVGTDAYRIFKILEKNGVDRRSRTKRTNPRTPPADG